MRGKERGGEGRRRGRDGSQLPLFFFCLPFFLLLPSEVEGGIKHVGSGNGGNRRRKRRGN